MTALPPVEVPWPHRDLHPNRSRGHWGKKARATKKARAEAAWEALYAWRKKPEGLHKPIDGAVSVTAIFIPPDNRVRDDDNLIASIKPTLDGIADVLGIDDSRFVLTARREDPCAPGCVRLELKLTGQADA